LQGIIVGPGCYCGMLLVGVISKITQNSCDMNEILLAPCDAGYVQNCTVHLGTSCDICDQAFSLKSSLNHHVNTVHKKITRFSCDLCDYSSYYRASIEKHSNAVHLRKKDVKCDICDQAFLAKSNLIQHVNNVHNNLTRYSCDLCNYSSYYELI
jgi:uncharacterized C2H2 Zn-finger protein